VKTQITRIHFLQRLKKTFQIKRELSFEGPGFIGTKNVFNHFFTFYELYNLPQLGE